MYDYLYVTEACLKVTITMFYCCYSKDRSNIMFLKYHKMFLIPSPCNLKKKNFLVNKYKKQIYHKENKYLFFEVKKNCQIFPSKVCQFQCYSFLAEKWGV